MKTSCSQARRPPTPIVVITALAPGSTARRSVAHFSRIEALVAATIFVASL